MQNDRRIITASNVNKKLSFQGWEKCAEVFSQGKGSLSFRCSQLVSQMDTSVSHLDAAISWSSSDEECNGLPSRLRPTRQLTSQINFDDCKPVLRKGRRQCSAKFIRSIEKRHDEQTFRNSSNYSSGPSLNYTQQVAEICISDDIPLSRGSATTNSETANELIGLKKHSILDQRINLSADCSENLLSTENSENTVITSPIRKENHEETITSPILKYPGTRNKRINRISKKPTEQVKEDENTSKGIHPLIASPVFKTSSARRKIKHRSLQDVPSNEKGAVCCYDRSASPGCVSAGKDLPNSVGKVLHLNLPHHENAAVKKSPQTLKKNVELDEPLLSPVIGTSSRRRKIPIHELISPILVSKFKPGLRRAHRVKNSSKSLPNDTGELNLASHLNETVDDFKFSDPPVLELNVPYSDCIPESEPLLTQSKVSVKRSLDFSHGSRNGKANEYDMGSLSASNNDHEKYVPQEAQDVTSLIDYSCLIEDVNTEQLDCDYVPESVIQIEERSQMKKKLKLSLSKKKLHSSNSRSSKQVVLGKEKNPSRSSAKKKLISLGEPKPLVPRPVSSPLKVESVDIDNFKSMDLRSQCSLARESPSRTLFIEEELSEPTEKPMQEAVNSTSAKVFQTPYHCFRRDNSLQVGKIESVSDDLDIEVSSSSQSVHGSQQTQIERLPSSCVSSPLTISQSSSPPAPNGQSVISGGGPDDFNAPPKRGKKKLKPDGLAVRLQRLLSRQRSSARIWQYQRSKEGKIYAASAGRANQSPSLSLVVERSWTEYSHVIVQGYVENGEGPENCSRYVNTQLNQVLLVIDALVAGKLGKIMSATNIQIFPPWQGLKLRGVSLILCAYCIEVVSSNSPLSVGVRPNVKSTEVPIPCEGGFERICGVSLADIVFPAVVEKSTCLFQYNDIIADESNEISGGPPSLGTISDLVSSHYSGEPTTDGVRLTILRVFHFNQGVSSEIAGQHGQQNPTWSLLGQDAKREVCEVVLGCMQPTSGRRVWKDIETGQMIGKTYMFFGLTPTQRISPFRVSSLWKIVSNINCLEHNEQPVFYVLAASNSVWDCHFSGEELNLDIYQPNFILLSSISSENCYDSRRVNIICRLLYNINERLYVTDVDMCPSIVYITLTSSAFLPSAVSKAAVIAVLDLEVVSSDFRADKYTRISALGVENLPAMNSPVNKEYFRCLATLNPELPILQSNTPTRSLAMFFGTVVGVDEDSAYMWPACGICENELLSLGDNSEMYRCEKCDDQCLNFILRMSLQVLCTSPNLLQSSSIRLKLLQDTIQTLLPPTLCGKEGYDMNAVLGQKLGPLKCEVLHSKDGNFTLQELPDLASLL